VTVVMVEGRRLMRRRDELGAEAFASLLREYRRVVAEALQAAGSGAPGGDGDTVTATFPDARQAALAATGARAALSSHAWPDGTDVAASIGVGAGHECEALCDAAEAGEIFVSPETARLLEDEELGDLSLRDLGERRTRRTARPIGAYELVGP
jgi:class 3 adenylate cyclase